MKALNGILKSFNKTLDQLDRLIKCNESEVNENTARIDALKAKNLDLIAEKQAAHNIANNIRDLLATNEK